MKWAVHCTRKDFCHNSILSITLTLSVSQEFKINNIVYTITICTNEIIIMLVPFHRQTWAMPTKSKGTGLHPLMIEYINKMNNIMSTNIKTRYKNTIGNKKQINGRKSSIS